MRRGTACVLLLVVALAGGCGSGSSKQDAAAAARARAQARLHARQMAVGRQLFAKNCSDCHTLGGRVAHPTFMESPIPNLDEVKPKADYVQDRAENGGFDMASFSNELSDAQLKAVAVYVAEVAGSRVGDTSAIPAAEVTSGEQVFRGNCERCHSIAGRSATNKPPVTYPGTDFNRVKPSEKTVMERALAGIPDEMPSFRGKLTRAQLQAVAAYVTATAGE